MRLVLISDDGERLMTIRQIEELDLLNRRVQVDLCTRILKAMHDAGYKASDDEIGGFATCLIREAEPQTGTTSCIPSRL